MSPLLQYVRASRTVPLLRGVNSHTVRYPGGGVKWGGSVVERLSGSERIISYNSSDYIHPPQNQMENRTLMYCFFNCAHLLCLSALVPCLP